MLSPYNYWQFWRNADDKDVVNFLKLFTDLDINQINNLKNNNQDINQLKIFTCQRDNYHVAWSQGG